LFRFFFFDGFPNFRVVFALLFKDFGKEFFVYSIEEEDGCGRILVWVFISDVGFVRLGNVLEELGLAIVVVDVVKGRNDVSC
jgi:hypothetical protein